MKLEEKDITAIREKWATMLTKEDLLDLLNYTKQLIYGEKAVPFDLKQLTWYANTKINPKRYTEFIVKKKSGGSRTIHAPVKGLKAIQKTLSVILQCVFEPHKAAMGFVNGKSIVDNARLHEGQNYVYNIDLKDFFPSVDQARVWKCLQLPPLNLNNRIKEKLDWSYVVRHGVGTLTTSKGEVLYYKVAEDNNTFSLIKNKGDFGKWIDRANELSRERTIPVDTIIRDSFVLLFTNKYSNKYEEIDRCKLANIIAALCCTEMEVERLSEKDEWAKIKRNVLPQGAPTSPVITNIVCQRLDFLLSGVAKRFGLHYSRYADDITFSSMHNVYQPEGKFWKELHRIIAEQGFYIKESKTRLQKVGYRQEVTGLLVNEKANVQKRYIKQLRMWLYYWEQYGYDRAYSFFRQQYVADKAHVKKGKPEMINVIAGKLDYLKMVKGAENELYLKLRNRFSKLSGVNAPMDALLDIWEKDGIDNAMNQYYEVNNN